MSYPWIQMLPGSIPFVLDFSPFESTLAIDDAVPQLGKDTSTDSHPSIVSIVGDDDGMPTNSNTGMAVTAISDVPFKAFANKISLYRGVEAAKAEVPCKSKQYPLKNQTSKGFLYRASHLMSDAVCFKARDIDAAAELVLDWMDKCVKLEKEDKPAACILLTNETGHGDSDRALKSLGKALGRKIHPKYFGRLENKDAIAHIFREIEVFQVCSSQEALPAGVFAQMALARRLRMANRHLWTYQVFCQLAKAVISHMADEPTVPLQFAKALDMSRPRSVASSGSWLTQQWRCWFKKAESAEMLTTTMIPIMAGCFARDSLKLGHEFKAEEVFDSVYRPIVEGALKTQTLLEEKKGIRHLLTNMRKSIREYRHRHADRSHVRAQQKHSDFFRKTSSREVCFGCLLAPSAVYFPCNCTLCESCCRAFGQRETGSTVLSFLECPLCCESYGLIFRLRLAPPTAGYRVLALDGGGVRGIIQLNIVSRIENELGLPLQLFIDLAVGTSVGGINALALGKLQWSTAKCKANFAKLSQSIFKQPDGWFYWLGTWPKSVSSLARALIYDGIYNSTGVEGALKQAFGQTAMIDPGKATADARPREQIKVAVTTTETTTSTCSLFTTYNKASHEHEISYRWAQECGALPNLKIWEAAQSTSAAPYYFPAKRLEDTGKMYQDGLNMPLPQARSEGRKLWPHKSRPDFLLSIGCGILRSAENQKSSWIYRFLHSALSALDGHTQYEKYRLVASADDQCDRIDPILEMDEVQLDDVEAMALMEKALGVAFASNRNLELRLSQLAWKMIGTLFYFEFLELPRLIVKGSNEVRLKCRGIIACRYQDDKCVMSALRKRYGSELMFSVNGHPCAYRNCKDFNFELQSWTELFKITLEGSNYNALVSGFPECAAKLVSLQLAAGQELSRSNLASNKRKHEAMTIDFNSIYTSEHLPKGKAVSLPCRRGGMLEFPQELINMVCDYLSPCDLLSLACCNHEYHQIVEPKLYASLDIWIGHHGMRSASAKLLNLFAQDPGRCRFIRSIQVRELMTHLYSGDQVTLLQILLRVILRSVDPAMMQSFIWTLAWEADDSLLHELPRRVAYLTVQGQMLRKSEHFPGLKQLDCGRIGSLNDLNWVLWHVRHCVSLCNLRIGIMPGRRVFRPDNSSMELFGTLNNFERLEGLILEVIDVRRLKLKNLPLLKRLELKRCPGTGEALNSMRAADMKLKSLSLTILNESHGQVADFLTFLAPAGQGHLDELTVLCSGSSGLFPLDSVLLHANTLRFLVLDSRRVIGDPTTASRYSIEHLQVLTQRCPRLVALGLPIDLEENAITATSRRPRRAESLKHIKPNCRLRILHLRGSYPGGVDIQKARVDAKHAARSFLPPHGIGSSTDDRQYVAVLINHKKQLRAFRVFAGAPRDGRQFAVVERTSPEDELYVDAQWNTQSLL